MKFYHGTNADNLESILKFGFNPVKAEKQVWTCSNYDNFFWSAKEILNSGEVETEEEAFERAKCLSFESAEMSLCKAKDCRRVVFEVDLPEGLAEPDTSCDNMDFAVMVSDKIDPKYITRYWIDSEDLSYFKAYFGSLINGRDLAEEVEFTSAERVMIDALSKVDCSSICEALSDLQCHSLEFDLNNSLTTH